MLYASSHTPDTDPKPEEVCRPLVLRNKALAHMLGVSTVTLWRMRKTLPPQVQISDGITGWRTSDIDAWLASRPAKRGAK